MAFVVLPEMVPTSKYPFYVAIISATVALASLLGPLLGGAVNRNIENNKIWEWIFFLK
jgi:MFS family permease